MPLICLGLAVTTDRTFPLDDRTPSELSARWARAVGAGDGLAMCSHGLDGDFSVRGAVDTDAGRQPDLIATAMRALGMLLAAEGIRILSWTAIESMTYDEMVRRARNISFPELVDAGRFAELCGVSRNRIHGLTAASRRARHDGRHHRFPLPIVPGYWLRSTADAFVRRRRVAPGPARKTGTEQFLDQLMAGEKARREGRPVPEADWSLLPSTMQEAFEENGYTPAEARALVSGESIPARGSTRADRSATSG